MRKEVRQMFPKRIGAIVPGVMREAVLPYLAQQLAIKADMLREALEIRARPMVQGDLESPYRRYPKKKKTGGVRWITAPHETLKKVQAAIYKRLLRPRYKPTPIAHGFIRGRGIVTNAAVHIQGGREPQSALNIDLQDAFPSVRAERVVKLFRKLTGSEELALTLGYLTTWKNEQGQGAIPQGAPSSPILLNSVLQEFDAELLELAGKFGLVVTRYVDDITLSGPDARIPDKVFTYVARLAKKHGFLPNMTKLRWQHANRNPIEITGLHLIKPWVGDLEVRLPAATRRRWRGILHNLAEVPTDAFGKPEVGLGVGIIGVARHVQAVSSNAATRGHILPYELRAPACELALLDRVPSIETLRDPRAWRKFQQKHQESIRRFELAYADRQS
ncbi:RNA-directed DNA polymerase [Candidatus Parcubacteria bacterium]|nr:RNA-directed DNA polymerase [Candidatus Parcubacteria bacterium]